ncbi:MAG: PAS domain S-box protein [bacterium]
MNDSSESKEAKVKPVDKEQLLQTILNTTLDGFWLVDLQGRFLQVNDTYCQMIGYSQIELLAMTVSDVEAIESREATAAHIREIAAKGEDRFESRHKRKDGSLYDVEISAQYQQIDGGCLIVFIRDITECKQAQKALRESNELFKLFIQNSPIYAYIKHVTPTENHVLHASDCFKEMIGLSGSDIVGKTMAELFPTELARKIIDDDLAVLTQGEVFKTNEVLNGRSYTSIKFPIVQDTKTLLAGYTIDITERELAERSLREEQTRMRTILDTVGDPIFVKDSDFRFVLANRAFYDMLGLDEGDVIGSTLLQDLPADEMRHFFEVDRQVLDTGIPDVREEALTVKDGRTLTIFTRKARFIDGSGNMFVVGAIHDITSRKKAEAELRNMQKLKSLGVLAGGVAHDFNNIMMGLFGYIALAKDELSNGHPGSKLLEKAGSSLGRATRLTMQLLTFAKGGDPVKEDVSLEALVEEVVQFDLSGSNVMLVFKAAPDLWLAEADRGQIQQVISNITINARQAMPEGGHLYITLDNVELQKGDILNLLSGKYIRTTVRDEGLGIDPSIIDRIFEPYFTTKQVGNGLGLAISSSIILKHNGHIAVTSELGKGTTFTIFLPAHEKRILPQIASSVEEAPSLPPARRILVLDDEESVLMVITHWLEKKGCIVDTYTDGRKVIEKYKNAMEAGTPFDVLILDLTIPGGIGGREVLKAILGIDPNAKAIASSGYADDKIMANFASYGFKSVLTKPYTGDQLIKVLENVVWRTDTPARSTIEPA